MNNRFYEARWWRSDCTVEISAGADLSDRIYPINWGTVPCFVPRGHREAYNPFDFYDVSGTGTRDTLQKTLPYEFGNLDPEYDEALHEFCRRFGIPGPFSELTWESWNKEGIQLESNDHPRVINDTVIIDSQQNLRIAGKTLRGRIPDEEVLRIQPVHLVRDECYKLKTCLSLARTIKEHKLPTEWYRDPRETNLLRGWLRPVPVTFDEAQGRLEEFLASESAGLRPTFRHDRQKQRWNLAWESLSLISLMYLMIALDLKGQGQVRTCECCASFFLADRPMKRFCSSQCQNRTKAKKYYRTKVKSRVAKGKRRNG